MEPGRPVSLNWSDDQVPPVAGAVGKRRRIHGATYSSRGVSLHTGRSGEPTTAVPIPEQIRAGEGGISQPFQPSHQARRSFAYNKGGIGGDSHRGRPYRPCARKGRPGHLRMQICAGAYWRQELGAIFDRTRLQHPRGRTPLPRAKWGRVSGTLTSVEDGKPKVAGQACCSDKGGQQEYAHPYAQSLSVVLILVGLVGLAHCKSLA